MPCPYSNVWGLRQSLHTSWSVEVMTDLTSRLADPYRQVVEAIRRSQSRQPGPLTVALDGGSGAGKSTLASFIDSQFDVALIPLDDFFSADISDSQWDKFTIEARLRHVFDWQRLRQSAIEPLRAGRVAAWYAFDFASGLRSDGTFGMQEQRVERQPSDVILLEGAYSACPVLSELIDLAILVDVPVETRHTRLVSREDKGFLLPWHQRWDPVEHYYFTRVRPRSSFDLVVNLE
jgi:uridine kinase